MDDPEQRDPRAPLYDPRYEHDACGIGFVADAGGHSRSRVLPLALAGLAALGHRGAFGADGASSDGAGISLPLDRTVLAHLTGPELAASRPAVVMLFIPPERGAARGARTLAEATFAAAGLAVVAWRRVPMDRSSLGAAAAASCPDVVQAVVARPTRGAGDPRPIADEAFERRLIVARRRLETAARDAGHSMAGLSVPSASALTVVYKGLVAGDRLADLYPDLRAPLEVAYALFHQRYATNTTPTWALAQPFRAIAHNGEINTVRGNRE
jgi:glutamate synthase (ferredoxin)